MWKWTRPLLKRSLPASAEHEPALQMAGFSGVPFQPSWFPFACCSRRRLLQVPFLLPFSDHSGRKTADPPFQQGPRKNRSLQDTPQDLDPQPMHGYCATKVKNLIGQYGVLHLLHPQCGCSSVKMCEQRTWTVCSFLLGPKPVTPESIGYQP